MSGLTRGLYELLITEALAAQLRELADGYAHEQTALRSAEAPDRIALHLSQVLHRALESLPDSSRVATAIALARALLDQIAASVPASEARSAIPIEAGEVLRLVAARLPDGRPEAIPTPLIPLLDTTLLTNAPGEPRVGHQIATEILSADRIDVVMAFIRRSGIAPLLDPHEAPGSRIPCWPAQHGDRRPEDLTTTGLRDSGTSRPRALANCSGTPRSWPAVRPAPA